MRLNNYISENLYIPKDFNELAEVIEKECSDILVHYRYANTGLFRGVTGADQKRDVTYRKGHLKNRRPKDTPQWAHDYMNELAVKKHGWPIRNGISTTTDLKQAQGYGRVFAFFPLNGFKYAFIDNVYDLFAVIDTELGQREMEDENWPHEWTNLHLMKKPIEAVKEVLENFVDQYETDYLKYAFSSGSGRFSGTEVMFHTKYYYLIRIDYSSQIIAKNYET